MGQIRKQTITSSFLSYIGFLIGAINTYFFTKQGLFTPEQYGLTQIIISISQIVGPLATLGMTAFMNRFFPYYFDNLPNRKNDMLTVAVIFSAIGAILVFTGCFVFEPVVVRKFSARSAQVVQYYYWSLVFAFSFLCFLILESYLGTLKKTVLPNFMKETAYRAFVSVLIALYAFGVISFNYFVILFCCIYLLIVLIMVLYLLFTGQLYLSLQFSSVTRRIRKQVTTYVGFVYTSIAVTSIAKQIDTLAVAGAKSAGEAGVYSLNQFSAAILQVPFRALQAIVTPMMAQHWKNKNVGEIERIFKRSSINLFLISSYLFFMIWLNYDDGLQLLGLDARYSSGKNVFLILGLYNILELTTGISALLIITSPGWRFEFYAGLVLLAFSIPLNIIMARWQGMEGVAMATFATFTIFNTLRLIFIKRRFNMSPFTIKTLYGVVLIAACYIITKSFLGNLHGFTGILLRSVLFSGMFVAGVASFRITPDLHQVWLLLRKRLKK